MNFRGLIWKRVLKIIFLVWYRVRIGRTARNTPRRIPRRNPSSPTTWHVILRGETTWNTRYWDFCDQLSGSLRGVLFNRIRPKYALKWRYSRSNGETVSYISLAANYISSIHSWHWYLYFKIIISSLTIIIRSLLCFDVSSWPVVKGWKKSCKVWFDCEFCELFSVNAGFEIAGEFSKTTEPHTQPIFWPRIL